MGFITTGRLGRDHAAAPVRVFFVPSDANIRMQRHLMAPPWWPGWNFCLQIYLLLVLCVGLSLKIPLDWTFLCALPLPLVFLLLFSFPAAWVT